MSFSEDKYADFIIDPGILQLREGNEVIAFVETFFKDYELTFSLLELVLLKEEGIGETYIFAKKDFDAKEFHKKYTQIVNEFKTEYSGGVSAFKEWYSRNTWWSFGPGNGEKKSYNSLQYKWYPKFEPKDLSQYGKSDSIPTPYKNFDDFIASYLNQYEERILQVGLGDHPFYSILIKPLGYLDSNKDFEIKPLGNLYLHFATNKEVSEDVLRAFIKDFMILWNKNYGGLLIDEARRRLATANKYEEESKGYLPKICYNKGKRKDKLLICYDKFFSAQENVQLLTDEINALTKTIIPKIKQIKENPDTNVKLDTKYYEQPKITDIVESYSPVLFSTYLIRRKIVASCMLHLNLSFDDTHLILTCGNLKKAYKEKEPNTRYNFFLYSLNISLPENKKENELKSILSDSLSDLEKSFLLSLI